MAMGCFHSKRDLGTGWREELLLLDGVASLQGKGEGKQEFGIRVKFLLALCFLQK